MSITNFTPNVGSPRLSGVSIPTFTVSTIATAGAVTLTTAQVMGGLILRDPAGSNRTDTLPTAVDIAKAIPAVNVGAAFRIHIRNTADAAETITVAAGTGGTTSGTMTIAQNNAKEFVVMMTAAGDKDGVGATYTVYSLGTVTF